MTSDLRPARNWPTMQALDPFGPVSKLLGQPEDTTDPAADPPGDGPPPGPDDGEQGPPARRPIDTGTVRLALLALASGIAFDIGLRGGLTNLVVVAGVALAVIAIAVDDHGESSESRVLALLALVPAVFLAVRVSPWLTFANIVLVVGLIGTAACMSQSGTVFDLTPQRLLRRAGWKLLWTPAGPTVLRPLVPPMSKSTTTRLVRMGLALGLTLPLVLLVSGLLASADAVFAGLVFPDVDLTSVPGHVLLTGLAVTGVMSVVAIGRRDVRDQPVSAGFGAIEIATMLSLAALVMALFAVAQLVALTSAGDRLVEEAGLTPAEYARTGFFQLCWAAALIAGFLTVVRMLAAPDVLDRPAIKGLSAAVPLLTLGLVVVSLRRMALYDEAFGLTMLRLSVVAAALWMGSVLVMLALRNLGLGGGRNWVVSGALLTALVLVVVANVGNAEAFVVRHNVDRAVDDGARLDAFYLSDLSDDALPAYVDAMEHAPSPVRRQLAGPVTCGQLQQPDDEVTGVAALNVSVARANTHRDGLCHYDSDFRY